MATLVLTVIGDDKSGLVDALSGVIADGGGNWDKSHMTQLAGKFAGIVLVTVPEAKLDHLVEALRPLEAQGLLEITAERADADVPSGSVRRFCLQLVGQDHPGIIRDVSRALAARNVNISDLQTSTRGAPMAGGMLFEATACLEVPIDVPIDELRESLEALANKLMVDIDFTD